jgi:hypothetical protein
MQSKRDVWTTTYFDRAVREKVGEALSAVYDLPQPLPERIRALLTQLEQTSAEGEAECGHPRRAANSR